MTAERDVERILERWLVDGVDEMPDRVYLTILDRVDRQPQQRAWRRLTWRFSSMSTPIKLVAVGATLLVVLVGGTVLVGGGSAPMATPQPTAVLPSSAIDCEDGLPGCAGMLTGGLHRSTALVPPLRFETIGGFWANVIDLPGIYKIDSMRDPTPGQPSIIVWTDASIADQGVACSAEPDPMRGRGTADWVEFVTTHPGIVATDPVERSISGRPARQFELSLLASWDQTCPGHAGPYVTLLTQRVEDRVAEYGLPGDVRMLFTVMDVADRTIVIQSYGPRNPAEFDRTMEPIRAIIDSFVMCGPSIGGPCGGIGPPPPMPSVGTDLRPS